MPFHPSVQEWDADLLAGDPLGFPGYDERRRALAKTGEAVTTGRTEHYAYIDGSLRGARAARWAPRWASGWSGPTTGPATCGLPVVVATRTGGRPAAGGHGRPGPAGPHRRRRPAATPGPACCRSACTARRPPAGVYASYGSLVDVRAAVEHAVIGFAGPRVAEGALGEPLPPGSHTAEAAYDEGLVDALLARRRRSPSGSTSPSG